MPLYSQPPYPALPCTCVNLQLATHTTAPLSFVLLNFSEMKGHALLSERYLLLSRRPDAKLEAHHCQKACLAQEKCMPRWSVCGIIRLQV
jgi:hypothetical protein